MSTADAARGPRLIDDDAFEAMLARARALAAGPVEGVYGPRSIAWRLGREAAVFLGAGRATLLQLAHPWVAESVARRATVTTETVKRFQRTFAAVYPTVFGDLDAAIEAARLMRRMHERVRGHMSESVGPFAEGTPYYAGDVEAALWVHATLVDTSVRVHERLIAPLTARERAQHMNEVRRGGLLFGVPEVLYPPDAPAFRAYVEDMIGGGTLAVGAAAKGLVDTLSTGVRVGPFRIAPKLYGDVTLALTPPAIRERFGLTLTDRQARRAEALLDTVARWIKWAPASLRYVGPYHEAVARLERRRPRLLHRMSSRLLTGASRP
ncbi:MAG: DUF2236 domain-containing protein [Caulobacterales bacterium]|nr:DUF2236 domain-containing protein [Caulobacterales bacterium]